MLMKHVVVGFVLGVINQLLSIGLPDVAIVLSTTVYSRTKSNHEPFLWRVQRTWPQASVWLFVCGCLRPAPFYPFRPSSGAAAACSYRFALRAAHLHSFTIKEASNNVLCRPHKTTAQTLYKCGPCIPRIEP